MDLNQDKGSSASSVSADSQKVAVQTPATTSKVNQNSQVDDGISFESDLKAKEIDTQADSPVSNEMKEEVAISSESTRISSGIESGASRFEAASVTANEETKSALSPDASPFPKPVLTEAATSAVVTPVVSEEEPKGEILTTFVNTQNYKEAETKKINPSMPQPTVRNETNFTATQGSAETSPVYPVTPDPTKTNESESHVNPASFAMPASAEDIKSAVEEPTQGSDAAATQNPVDPSSSIKNHVPLSEHYDHIASSSESAPATIVPGKKKAGLKWLWITLGSIFGVLFVFAGLVTATETGVINWGLDTYYSKMGVQKIWKGLPFDSRGALLISATQMAKINQSHIVADMTMNVSVGADSAAYSYLHDKGGKFAADFPTDPNVATGGDIEMTSGDSTAIADTVPSVPTFDNFSVNLKFDTHANSTKSDTSFTIQSDMLPTYMSMVELTPEEGNKITSEQKFTGDAWYSHMPLMNQILGVDVTKWIKTESTDLESLGLSTAEESASDDLAKEIEDYSKVIKSGTRTGVETIDGVKANKYHFEIDMVAAAVLSGEDESNIDDNYKNTTISADIWIGQKDKFIRKVVLNLSTDMDGTAISLVANVTVSDINKDFEVVAPADDQVETKTMNELLENVTGQFLGSEEEPATAEDLTLSPSATDPKTWVTHTCNYAPNSSFTIKLPTEITENVGSGLEDCYYRRADRMGLAIEASFSSLTDSSYDENVKYYTDDSLEAEKVGAVTILKSPSAAKISGLLATDIPYFATTQDGKFSRGIIETLVKIPKGTLRFSTEISGGNDFPYISSEYAGVQETIRKSIFDTIVIK